MSCIEFGEDPACLLLTHSGNLYCSLCGCPTNDYIQGSRWLIDVAIMHGSGTRQLYHLSSGASKADSFSNVLINKAKVTENPYGATHNPWFEDLYPLAIPMHCECLTIAALATKHLRDMGTDTNSLSNGGAPCSLLDVYRVLLARASETNKRTYRGCGPDVIFSPDWYGGIHCVMDFQGWGSNHVPRAQSDALLSSPRIIDFFTIGNPKGMLQWPLPRELVDLIFKHVLQDLSGPCSYIFDQSMWKKHLEGISWLQGFKFPVSADFEQLARKAWRIQHQPSFADAGGMYNRHRIWKQIIDMRFDDTFDIRACFCLCFGTSIDARPCGVRRNTGADWCRGSWANVRKDQNLPSDWRPTWADARIWSRPSFINGTFEREWEPANEAAEIDEHLLRHLD